MIFYIISKKGRFIRKQRGIFLSEKSFPLGSLFVDHHHHLFPRLSAAKENDEKGKHCRTSSCFYLTSRKTFIDPQADCLPPLSWVSCVHHRCYDVQKALRQFFVLSHKPFSHCEKHIFCSIGQQQKASTAQFFNRWAVIERSRGGAYL